MESDDFVEDGALEELKIIQSIKLFITLHHNKMELGDAYSLFFKHFQLFQSRLHNFPHALVSIIFLS